MRPEPYIPDSGLAVVGAAPATPPGIDLSLNESAFGVSPLAVAAARTRAERLHRYPDPASAELRAAIGKAFDLDPGTLVCGNGSEEILDLVGRLYARPGDEILFADYGFLQFPIVAARVGATPVTAPMRDLRIDVDALLARVSPRTKIVFLDNPNNPCGRYVPAAEVERLRDGLPVGVVLVIDSAYADFVRGVDDYGLDDCLRITVGLPADNDAVIAALTGFMV